MQNDTDSASNNKNALPTPDGNSSQFLKFKKLLSQIAGESDNLRGAIMTQSEREDLNRAALKYDKKVQEMLIGTKIHLELYRESGWKDLIYGEKSE